MLASANGTENRAPKLDTIFLPARYAASLYALTSMLSIEAIEPPARHLRRAGLERIDRPNAP